MPDSTLDIDRILRETFVVRVEHRRSLTSTNDLASRLAAEKGGALPLLVVADRQTAGRGRGGNRWWTGRGSLAMSLLLDADVVRVGRRRTPLISLAAAVAVVETAAPLLPDHTVGIHWPNDVLAAGRKLAGVLIEVLPGGRTILGIGLNTNNSLADAPEELRGTATTLLELGGRPHDRTDVLVALLGHLEGGIVLLQSAPRRIAARADELCLQHGRTLRLQQGSRSVTGRCAGIDADGALLLETGSERRRYFSGVLQ